MSLVDAGRLFFFFSKTIVNMSKDSSLKSSFYLYSNLFTLFTHMSHGNCAGRDRYIAKSHASSILSNETHAVIIY